MTTQTFKHKKQTIQNNDGTASQPFEYRHRPFVCEKVVAVVVLSCRAFRKTINKPSEKKQLHLAIRNPRLELVKLCSWCFFLVWLHQFGCLQYCQCLCHQLMLNFILNRLSRHVSCKLWLHIAFIACCFSHHCMHLLQAPPSCDGHPDCPI